MILPAVPPRMVEGHKLAADGITSLSFGVFVVVTTLASECQIIQLRQATLMARHDMFDSKGIGRKILLAPAILAASMSALGDEAALVVADPGLTHG